MAVISKNGSDCPRFQQVPMTSLTETVVTSFKIAYYILLNVIKLIPIPDMYSKLTKPLYFPISSIEQIIK